MKVKVVIHEDHDGGFWAEVLGIPGCGTQAATRDELMHNLHEAIEGCLASHFHAEEISPRDQVIELCL